MGTQQKSLRVGVIGAGVMGHGIAQTTATAGYPTVCFDISKPRMESSHSTQFSQP